MALSPPTYTPMPYTAYVRVKAGGTMITLTPDNRPRYLESFSFTRTVNAAGDFSLTLFDEDWDVVQTILNYHSKDLTFQYGYEGTNIKSPEFNMVLATIKPEFLIDGVRLTITGNSVMMFPSNLRRVRSMPELGGSEKSISDIVKKILTPYGFKLEIDETHELKSAADHETHEQVQIKMVQGRMNDLQYIRNVLAPKAIRKKDDVTGYVFYFDDETQTFHFHPPRTENSAGETFFFMRNKMSEVIQFSVETDTLVQMSHLGNHTVLVPYWDIYQKKFGYYRADNETTEEKTYLAKYMGQPFEANPVKTTEEAPCIITTPVDNRDIARVVAKEKYIKVFNTPVEGELTIQGKYYNPDTKGRVIQIVVTQKDGSLHYTSGNYLIGEMVDEITAGKWITRIKVQRNGHMDGIIEAIGKPNVAKGK